MINKEIRIYEEMSQKIEELTEMTEKAVLMKKEKLNEIVDVKTVIDEIEEVAAVFDEFIGVLLNGEKDELIEAVKNIKMAVKYIEEIWEDW